MTAGHFGLAAGVKAWAPKLPLWALMIATYLLDITFVGLYALGIEWLSPIDLKHPNVYGGMLIHAYYTHSLLGALLISAVVGLIAARMWGHRGGLVIALVVFSHWVLDLIVHRPDLPILPDNLGYLPLLGLGLWRFPMMSITLELILVLGGSYLYYLSASRLPVPASAAPSSHRVRVLTASGLTAALLLALLIIDYFG